MFFMARTVAPMFTGSCGSYSTTTTDARSDSDIGEAERDQARLLVTISAKIDELSPPTAEHELSSATLAPVWLLVDDDVERNERAFGIARHVERNVDVHSVPTGPALPTRRQRHRARPTFDRAAAHAVRPCVGHEQNAGPPAGGRKVELHAVAIDVGHLVVVRIHGVRGRKGAVGARNVDREP